MSKLPTDFNDLHSARGLEAVREQVEKAVGAAGVVEQPPAPRADNVIAITAKETLRAFAAEIEAADDIDALYFDIWPRVVRSGLPRPAVEHLAASVAKKMHTSKAALLEELKGGGRSPPGGGDGGGDGGDGPEGIIGKLNEKHAVVQWEGSTLIASFERCPITKGRTIKYSSRRDFELRYLNRKIWMDGEEMNWAEYWLHHADRRQYDGTVFLPGTAQTDCVALLNLWNGWGVKPVAGNCQLYLDFVDDFICSKNIELSDYLINWCAHMVQRPRELPETAITLRGGQGLGKNTFIEPLMKIVGGDHALEVSSSDHVVGRFNGHLETALLIFNNESLWGGDKQAAGKLKAMVTDQRGLVERKGKDAKMSRNFRRLINASNNLWATSTELDDRRNVIIDVNPTKAPAETFARLRAWIAGPGPGHLFHYLLYERDITDWHPRNIPHCLKKFGRDMALESEPTPYRFWNTVLHDGYLFRDADAYSLDRSTVWPDCIEKGKLHDLYLGWCRKMLVTHPEGREFFGKIMARCGLRSGRPTAPGGDRYHAYLIPTHVEAVKFWCTRFNFEITEYLDNDEL